MGIYHKFVSNKADFPTGPQIQPSDWNAAHVHPMHLIWALVPATTINWLLPEIRLEYGGDPQLQPDFYGPGTGIPTYRLYSHRTKYDFTYCSNIRTVYKVETISNGGMQFEYSETGVDTSFLPLGNVLPTNVLGLNVSDNAIPAGAKKDVWIRLVGFGGNYAAGVFLSLSGVYLYTD